MEEGGAPRDVLRRRVRTAEFYYGNCEGNGGVSLYDEFTDNFCMIAYKKLLASCADEVNGSTGDATKSETIKLVNDSIADVAVLNGIKNWLLVRPCIEHYMLAAVIGRGGLQHLGATLWGQTELSVFDDGQHGTFGSARAVM